MKLYIYEHCPYCIRPRMLANYKNIDLEIKYFSMNDSETPTSFIGKKMAPILQKDDGSYMGESLDILEYLDNLDTPIFKTYQAINLKIQDWHKKLSDDSLLSKLLTPEMIKQDFPEFSSKEDLDYMVNRFLKNTGLTIEESVAMRGDLLTKMHKLLDELADLLEDHTYINEEFSIDDILLFPNLKRLCMVENLKFPKKVQNYVESVSLKVKLSL